MAVFDIRKIDHKDGTYGLHPSSNYYTEEYAKKYYSFYLTDELYRNKNGDVDVYYRLHAREPHDNNMVLAYDVYCPKCRNIMRQVTTIQDENTLGYYECKNCNKK